LLAIIYVLALKAVGFFEILSRGILWMYYHYSMDALVLD
jgi:hypothetical protein